MDFLNRLRLKQALILMVLLPLAGMIWVAGWNTTEKVLLSREMGQLRRLVDLSTTIGGLVHELQRERGMSVGFLASGGANFADKLPRQRDEAGRRLDGYRAALSGFDAGAHAGLPPLLAEATALLDDLPEKRKAVSAFALKPPEAGAYYTKTIAALLSIAGRIANLSSDRDIARLAAAYHALLQAKERAGIERATLAGVFGDNHFAPDMQVRFLSNAAAQDTWFAVFKGLASEGQAAFSDGKMTGPAVEEVARIKKEAVARMREPELGMDATAWFKASTERIDLLKEVEDRLADDLSSGIRKLKMASGRIALAYAVLTLLSSILVLWLTWRIVSGILRRVGGEPRTAVAVARAVAEGKLDNEIALAPGDDSSILASMEQMQANLRERIERDRRRAAETLRIKIALDSIGTPVTVSDGDNRLIYMNPAARRMFEEMAPRLAARIAGFSVEGMSGEKVDILFEDEAMLAACREERESSAVFETALAGKLLRLVTNPIFDEGHAYIGRVTQWLDRTAEVQVEREVAEIVEAGAMGILSMRLDMAGKEGFFAALGKDINQLLDGTELALDATSAVLARVALGDLTRTVDGDYMGTFGQLKDDTNATVERLREVVGRIKESSEAVNQAALEIAAGNRDLSARTEEQASSLEETASSMEELNATVRQNADNSRQANDLAKKSNEIANKGGVLVKRVVEMMEEIQGSSKKIADIIGVIDSIAFQTNILALNAAVEAARAGEQGRGFAVVASEVRNLAQRSATAAKEIKALIAESVDKVESGAKLVQEAGDTMDDVVTSFDLVANLVTEISNASREQSAGIEQVTKAVAQMDEVTQQNAALVEEAAAAAESLEEQARGLVQAVGMFKLAEGGANLPGPALRDATPKRLAAL